MSMRTEMSTIIDEQFRTYDETYDKNEKEFNEGEIVFWIHRNPQNYLNYGYKIEYGIVTDQASKGNVVYIDRLQLRDDRLVNGIPYKEYCPPNIEYKIPKGHKKRYDDNDKKLIEKHCKITHIILTKEEKNIINELETTKSTSNENVFAKAYQMGLLVKVEDIDYSFLDVSYTKTTYKICKYYPSSKDIRVKEDEIKRPYISIIPSQLYKSYKDAEEELNKTIMRIDYLNNLSDHDYFLHLLEETLGRYIYVATACYGINPDEVRKIANIYKQWILDNYDITNIDIRFFNGTIQIKKIDKNKWYDIEITDFQMKTEIGNILNLKEF